MTNLKQNKVKAEITFLIIHIIIYLSITWKLSCIFYLNAICCSVHLNWVFSNYLRLILFHYSSFLSERSSVLGVFSTLHRVHPRVALGHYIVQDLLVLSKRPNLHFERGLTVTLSILSIWVYHHLSIGPWLQALLIQSRFKCLSLNHAARYNMVVPASGLSVRSWALMRLSIEARLHTFIYSSHIRVSLFSWFHWILLVSALSADRFKLPHFFNVCYIFHLRVFVPGDTVGWLGSGNTRGLILHSFNT